MQSVPCLDHLIISHQLKESQGRGEQLGFINQHQPVIEKVLSMQPTQVQLCNLKKKKCFTQLQENWILAGLKQ